MKIIRQRLSKSRVLSRMSFYQFLHNEVILCTKCKKHIIAIQSQFSVHLRGCTHAHTPTHTHTKSATQANLFARAFISCMGKGDAGREFWCRKRKEGQRDLTKVRWSIKLPTRRTNKPGQVWIDRQKDGKVFFPYSNKTEKGKRSNMKKEKRIMHDKFN